MTGWPDAGKNPAYWTTEYRRARDECLRRARRMCQRQIPGVCTGTATEANHRRGLAADPHHRDLEAVCAACHKVITQAQATAARKRKTSTPFIPRTKW
jgi:hypothetical protein